MDVIYYAIFALASWFFLMQIFKFSTYHKYFKFAVFFILSYSVLNGYLFYFFHFQAFFFWHLLVFLVLFFNNFQKQKKIGAAFENLIDVESGLSRDFFETSLLKTLKYYVLSALIYLIVFAGTYIYYSNR